MAVNIIIENRGEKKLSALIFKREYLMASFLEFCPAHKRYTTAVCFENRGDVRGGGSRRPEKAGDAAAERDKPQIKGKPVKGKKK